VQGKAMQRRVVFTGLGTITAAGSDVLGFWRALLAGRDLIRPLQTFSTPEMTNLYGAEVPSEAADALPAEVDSDGYRSRCAQLALTASRRALVAAGLADRQDLLAEAALVLGTTLGEERQVAFLSDHWTAEGSTCVNGGFIEQADNHRLAAIVASAFGLGGPVMLSATACASGSAALAWAYDLVSQGEVAIALAGGADTFTRLIYNGFSRMGALAPTVCKPFDRSRNGVAFGEGAGMLVLESLEHAQGRGATILGELAGYGISNDAYHVTAPEPNGAGYVRAIEQALVHSGVAASEIGYICAHGTGTPYNDAGEVRAIKAVFGEHASSIAISSPKSILGHTNGAAGALGAIVCVLALAEQKVPPTANLNEPDPEFGLDFVIKEPRSLALNSCLNISAGFGGFNACLVLRRAP
jgi:3-oxoacyl-[acyl-carrier-protein] synthase II